MHIAVAADHKGLEFKQKVIEILKSLGNEITDFGTNTTESVDYPDFGLKVAEAVRDGKADFGITVCWTGNGMNMVANKVKGIRAGLALNTEMAHMTRLHNDANILTLSQKYTPENELEDIVKIFLSTKFEGGRHAARIQKITDAEEE